MQGALNTEGKKTHTWWELWNNAVSGMFPRRPVGCDGGPSGGLKGIVCNLTHILGYVVTFILHLALAAHGIQEKKMLLQLEGLPV